MNAKYIALCLLASLLGGSFSVVHLRIWTNFCTGAPCPTNLFGLSVWLGVAFTLASFLVWLYGELYDYSDSRASYWAKQMVIGMLASAATVPFLGGIFVLPFVAAFGSVAYLHAVVKSLVGRRRSSQTGMNQ